jgi:hypothetical protein
MSNGKGWLTAVAPASQSILSDGPPINDKALENESREKSTAASSVANWSDSTEPSSDGNNLTYDFGVMAIPELQRWLHLRI